MGDTFGSPRCHSRRPKAGREPKNTYALADGFPPALRASGMTLKGLDVRQRWAFSTVSFPTAEGRAGTHFAVHQPFNVK
jgi:hypothetical protein